MKYATWLIGMGVGVDAQGKAEAEDRLLFEMVLLSGFLCSLRLLLEVKLLDTPRISAI